MYMMHRVLFVVLAFNDFSSYSNICYSRISRRIAVTIQTMAHPLHGFRFSSGAPEYIALQRRLNEAAVSGVEWPSYEDPGLLILVAELGDLRLNWDQLLVATCNRLTARLLAAADHHARRAIMRRANNRRGRGPTGLAAGNAGILITTLSYHNDEEFCFAVNGQVFCRSNGLYVTRGPENVCAAYLNMRHRVRHVDIQYSTVSWNLERKCETCSADVPQFERLSCPCQFVRYCSSNCQRANWRQHKPLCKWLRALRDGYLLVAEW